MHGQQNIKNWKCGIHDKFSLISLISLIFDFLMYAESCRNKSKRQYTLKHRYFRSVSLHFLPVPNVLKSGSLSLMEPSGPVQDCNGIASDSSIQISAFTLPFKNSPHTLHGAILTPNSDSFPCSSNHLTLYNGLKSFRPADWILIFYMAG